MDKITIEQAKRLFSEWRQMRKDAHVRTPDRLRKIAIALWQEHGDSIVCGELKVSSSSLWEWRQQLKQPKPDLYNKAKIISKVQSKKAVEAVKNGVTDFVELRPILAPTIVPTLQIEWQRQDGNYMRLSGITEVQVAKLVGQFLVPQVVK